MVENAPNSASENALVAPANGLAVDIDIEPKLRKMTILLTNKGGELTFRQGTPSATLPSKGSLLRLHFENYFGKLALSGVKCHSKAWNAQAYSDGNCDLAFAPSEDLVLRPGQPTAIVLDDLDTSTAVRGTFLLAIDGVDGLPSQLRQVTCAVRWETKTGTDLPLLVAFEPPSVIADGLTGEMRLILTNAKDTPLACDATFELAFVSVDQNSNADEEAGELTFNSPTIAPELGGASANWHVEVLGNQGDKRTAWLLKARRSNESGWILGTGAAASVSFLIKGIKASNPGVSLATLKYFNISGYDDGSFNLPILKVAGNSRELPRNTIIMWSGDPTHPPKGWLLCDGNNGTPNLFHRFVLGAGPKGDVAEWGKTGGSSVHSHQGSATVTIQDGGGHNHGVPSTWYANSASSGGGVTVIDRRATREPWATEHAGHHGHGASANVTVAEADQWPPWYALCFLMKET